FAPDTLDGSVNPTTAVTDANGHAATVIALGGKAGPQTFSATVGSVVVTVNEQATIGTATQLFKISGDGQSGIACSTLANSLEVRVTDPFGNPVPSASVIWAQTGGPGSHNSSALLTDTLGYSAVLYTLPNTAGVDTLTATLQLKPTQSVAFLATITTTQGGQCASGSRISSSFARARHVGK
ncbi:MAG TPA: hypothetical protein VIJ16_03870, partial [Gemmatimonadaceae bacterium]